ncbi:hypothetical protein ACFX1R_043997 [Malus domestica]
MPAPQMVVAGHQGWPRPHQLFCHCHNQRPQLLRFIFLTDGKLVWWISYAGFRFLSGNKKEKLLWIKKQYFFS